jgi:hypothetical protein
MSSRRKLFTAFYNKTYNKNELLISIQTGNNIIKHTLLAGKAHIQYGSEI